jgi:hypothetical protein
VNTRDLDAPLFFYELHESDSDILADILICHATEYDEAEFLELVLDARTRVLETFTQDSLIEGIAADLAERSGFLIIDDSQLRVAVNVSSEDDATFVADVDEGGGHSKGGDDDFRTLVLDIDPEDAVWGDERPD